MRGKLEELYRAEVAELLDRAEEADLTEGLDGDSTLSGELERRHTRIKRLEWAQAELAERARKRDEANLAAYEEKVAARARKEEETGEKPKGRNPKPPETGSQTEGSSEFHRPGFADHAVH